MGVMSIRLFLCTSIRIVAIDVSHGVLTGGSITFDVVTFGKVRSKGAFVDFPPKEVCLESLEYKSL